MARGQAGNKRAKGRTSTFVAAYTLRAVTIKVLAHGPAFNKLSETGVIRGAWPWLRKPGPP
jgi:hypothetical protein